MKPWQFVFRLFALITSSLGATQAAETAADSKEASRTKEEPVVLSPFEVGADSERGYQSTAMLQGGRGRIELADVAGQVAVFTKDFLDDIGATTTDEAYLFSATTQTYYDNVNGSGDSRPGSRNTADDGGNSRGLGNLDKTRNYFRTTIDSDSYNTERFSLVSGANAVQFGLGGAAGTSESTSARAYLNRNRQKVQVRTDTYGSERAVLDISQVILPNKLALRAIGLRDNKEYFLRPGDENSRRGFLTTTYQPFKDTTVRVEGEYVHRKDARPPTTMGRDVGYLSWLATQSAGMPLTYANRAATAATAGRPPAPSFTLPDGTSRAYAFSTKQALYVWPDNSVPNFTGLQDVRNTVWVAVGDGASTAGQTQSLRHPGYPWNTNTAGFSRYNFRRSRNLQATIEQRLARHTFIELGYSYEFYRNQTAQLFANNAYDVMADINQFLPDGMTPNPLYGRPFMESNNQAGQGQWTDFKLTQYRAVVAHEWDRTRAPGWTRHLGRHRFGFFASFDDSATYTLAQLRYLVVGQPSFLSAAARNDPLSVERGFHMRHYLPPLGARADPGAYALSSPDRFGDLMETLHFTTPSGEPFDVTAYENPIGGVGTAPRADHLQRGSLAASTSSSFFSNRLVANVGVRHDRVRNSDFAAFEPVLVGLAAGGYRAYADFRDEVPPDVWTKYRSATRVNYGFVVRPPRVERWLSFGYDFSKNASLNEVAVVRDVTGAVVEPPYGESHEYSVRFRLLSDRLYVKVNYFNSLNRNITLADSGLRQNLINFEQQLLINDPSYPINPLFLDELNPVPANFRLPGDRNSKGVEVDVTFNPTPNWRVFWNAGRAEMKVDDLSTEPTWDYLEQRLAVWRTFRGNWATATYDGTRSVEAAHNALIQGPIDDVLANLGNPGGNSQTWRSNLVATRSFTTGRLKGAALSANFRYRGPSIVGFQNRIDEKGRTRLDRDKPYKSEAYVVTGLMANYRFRSFAKTAWRVQFNANNVFNTRRVFLTRTYADGSPRNYGRQAGREFILALDVEH